MPIDVRQEGVRNVEAVQVTNRGLLERALHMRAASYLAQQKAVLLTQTIFEIDRSKQALRERSRTLEQDQATIHRQKVELEARTAALEEVQRTLEERVRRRTLELERANAAVRLEAAARDHLRSEGEQLTERYLHAQKLELVGRLAGGVAHDFNNLLTVILGHGELIRSTVVSGTQLAEDVDNIIEATRRGAALTRQLLSFAGKQPRSPAVIDPAMVVRDFAKLMRRALGSGVKLELRLEPGVGNVRASVSELEQVLLNLVVNARDAMPNGGTIVVSLSRVVRPEPGPAPHGPCVAICVDDTGEGMTDDVLQHVFEPFFTTKEKGVGTGLGLSTVATIVRDCDGTVDVESRPGAGTTFRVYLPVIAAPSELPAARDNLAELPRGNEVVLVIDDDESIRAVVRQLLLALGYRVLTASRMAAALEILGRERVHVMLLDSVAAGAEKEEFDAEVALRWPETRVVLMSGYADRPPPRDARGSDWPLVEKPLELAQLANTLRSVLSTRAH